MQTHYFLAVPLPDTMKQQLADWLEDKKQQYPFKSWVYPLDYHITLHFLGGVHNEQLDQMNLLLPGLLRSWSPFELTMTHFGIFGQMESPRVFWAGLEHEPILHHLQEKIGEELKQIDLEVESRPYQAHITLARRWSGEKSFILPDLHRGEWQFSVDQVILYRTHVDRVPKYKGVCKFPLLGVYKESEKS